MTSEQQQQLDALDAFHGQAKALIAHGGGPAGAQKAGFNLLQFAKNAWTIFQVVWPVLKPMIAGSFGLDPTTLAPIAPDPALPPKA